ncbi:hypothetical protein V6N11_061856 [Hibiscus sabdariffa]|uniref:Uncharacterized protein n=1 Tax=Hibiscus sabdariffa TaxID=183260 RepID=A0ABR2NC80_9ROSI
MIQEFTFPWRKRGPWIDFWKKREWCLPLQFSDCKLIGVSSPQVSTSTLRQVQCVIAGDNREVLDRCEIGWCKSPISNADLTRALRSDDIVLFK